MSDGPNVTEAGGTRINTSAGHLSLKVDGAHPAEVDFSFDREPKRLSVAFCRLCGDRRHTSSSCWCSPAVTIPRPRRPRPCHSKSQDHHLVERARSGAAAAVAGGNKMKEPPKKAELPGKDKLTVPVEKKPSFEQSKVEPNPVQQLNIPAKELSSALESLPGAIGSASRTAHCVARSGAGGARAPALERHRSRQRVGSWSR